MTQILSFLKYFIPFGLLLFFSHFLFVTYVLVDLKFELGIYSIYLFLFLTTLLIYIFLVFVNTKYPEKTGFAFLTSSLLKMIASVVFLLPIILSKNTLVNDVIAFFISYFLFLTFETIFAIRLINNS
jgi:hypothetical protein